MTQCTSREKNSLENWKGLTNVVKYKDGSSHPLKVKKV